MPQQVRKRNQATVAFSTGNKVAEKLSKGMIYRELELRLTAQPTLTTANNTYAKTLRGDEWAVVKRIDLIANGTQTIKSISGPRLRMMNYFWYGKHPRVSVALGAGGANPSCASTLLLPLWMPRSVRPIDTALDSRQMSNLEIAVTWGTFTDINASATAWTTEPSLRVDSLESFGIEGPFANWRYWEIEKTISATSSSFQVDLPVGGQFRGFFINTTEADADSSGILNNIKWKSGTTVFADVNATMLQEAATLQKGITRGFSGTAYDDVGIGDANDLDGWYYYDHVTDGMLTEAIDTVGFSEHELELDVTNGSGVTKVIIIPQVIIPVRNAA